MYIIPLSFLLFVDLKAYKKLILSQCLRHQLLKEYQDHIVRRHVAEARQGRLKDGPGKEALVEPQQTWSVDEKRMTPVAIRLTPDSRFSNETTVHLEAL